MHAGRALAQGTAVFGELTLSGALRPATGAEQRVSEALRRGAQRILVPESQRQDLESIGDGRLSGVRRLVDALEFLSPVPSAAQAGGGASPTVVRV